MKAMISQPMDGRTDKEINEEREIAIERLENEGYEVVETYFTDEIHRILERNNNIPNKPLWYLSQSLRLMSKCDAVYFCEGWEDARGCVVEHTCAFNYGLKIMYEESEEG